MYENWVGKYVICRSYNEGINAGYVKAIDSTGVVISNARRLFYHAPKDKNLSWYEGVAQSGLSDDSVISSAVEKKLICEDYSLTLCSKEAELSILSHKANAQS